MTFKQTERLLKLLRANGVTRYKALDLELEMGGCVPAEPATPPRAYPEAHPKTPAPDGAPEAPALVPASGPSKEIPHHVDEVKRLLKMGDEDLVDALFPVPKGVEG